MHHRDIMRELKEPWLYWTEDENKKYEETSKSLADFGRFLMEKMTQSSGKASKRRFKMSYVIQDDDALDRIYIASTDQKHVYMIRLFSEPRPMTNDLCQRYGWRFGPEQYSLYKMTAKEYGFPLTPHPFPAEAPPA